jgi:hypothetical protein
MSKTRPQPKARNYFDIGNKCQNRALEFSTGLVFVVTFGRATLFPVASHYQ